MPYKTIAGLALISIVSIVGYNTISNIIDDNKAQALEVATLDCTTKIEMRAKYYAGDKAKKEAVAQCIASRR